MCLNIDNNMLQPNKINLRLECQKNYLKISETRRKKEYSRNISQEKLIQSIIDY